jgi:phage baseplate assembly protein W
MAITPDADFGVLLDEDTTEDEIIAPAKTYRLDFNTGRLAGIIDEVEALKQYIVKAILTPRSELQIYSEDYGSEIEELLGETATQAYREAEIPRMVREAIEDDDRIVRVDDVKVTSAGDAIYINVTVSSVYGEISEEVTLVV